MRRALACAALPAALLAGRAAYACGAPFGANVAADPRQDIIVAWKNDVETYAFQPTFCGAATDFGLLLPVPSPLVQQPAQSDPQAFATAAALSEPQKKRVTESSAGCMAGDSMGAGRRTRATMAPRWSPAAGSAFSTGSRSRRMT